MRQRAKDRRTQAKGGGRVSPPFKDAQAALTWLVVEGFARVARDDEGRYVVTLPSVETGERFNETSGESVETFSAFQQKGEQNREPARATGDGEGVETSERFNETSAKSVETFSAFQQKGEQNREPARATGDGEGVETGERFNKTSGESVETFSAFQQHAQSVPGAIADGSANCDNSPAMLSTCGGGGGSGIRARTRRSNLLVDDDFVRTREEEEDLGARRKQSSSIRRQRNGNKVRAKTTNLELVSEKPKRDEAAIARVFEHWRQLWNRSPRCKLDKKRRMVIARALDEYGEEFVVDALTGYTFSLHHTGHNERATVYDEITLHLRDAEHIEAGHRFLERRTTPIRSAKEVTRAIRNADAMAWAREADAKEGQ